MKTNIEIRQEIEERLEWYHDQEIKYTKEYLQYGAREDLEQQRKCYAIKLQMLSLLAYIDGKEE